MQLPAQIGQTPGDGHAARNAQRRQKGLLPKMLGGGQVVGDDGVHAVIQGAAGDEGDGRGDEKRGRGGVAATGKHLGVEGRAKPGQQVGQNREKISRLDLEMRDPLLRRIVSLL